MARIYTRSGDQGTTGLANGQRIKKDATRMHCIGHIDELNALLGIVIASAQSIASILQPVQHQLFELGAELAAPDSNRIKTEHILLLEKNIDELDAKLPALKAFILPGGNLAAAYAHQTRAVCRRAERCLFKLSQIENINPDSLKYLNRLSDLLFVIARTLTHKIGTEIIWQQMLTTKETPQ